MVKEYKEEVLKNLGVYELRELARRVGVLSPTTKKRKQLEEEILKISKGETVAEVKKTKKGRPPKSIKKLDNIVDVFVPKELIEISLKKNEDEEFGNLLKFASSLKEDFEKHEVSGFLKKTISGNYYFKKLTNNNQIISVSVLFAKEFELIEGDFIHGMAGVTSTENVYILENIQSINGHKPVKNRKLIDINKMILKREPIKGLNGINEGDNILFINQTFKDGINKLKELIKGLEDDYNIVILASNISVYTKLLIEKNLKCRVVYSLIEDHPANAYEQALSAGKHVDVLLKEGKKVMFVILDFYSLLAGVKNFFMLETQRDGQQEQIESTRFVQKLFNYGKVIEGGASVTVLTTCLEHEAEGEVYKSILLKNADKILKI